ncbi:MAG: hypothetical protein MAG458_00273 [Nitrosopumilus sp.]|nr:hypothetical protein [Nitrosopumilus sp.]
MALRDVKPLDSEQWSKLQEIMKRGSSEKQLKTIQESKSLRNVEVEF